MPEITGLVPLRGVRGRLRVFLDEEYAFTVSEKKIAHMELKVGNAIDPREMLETVCEDEKNRALHSALYFLGRAERSRAQVVRYLEAREYLPEIIEGVIEKIEEYGYVNDTRFAGMLLNDRAKIRGKSRRAIKHEMAEKGLDAQTIEDAMAQYDQADEHRNAMHIAKKYYMKNEGNRQDFERKAGAALFRRGYDYDVIREVLHAVQDGREEEEE
ncbi:MAG: regulatory protein RecX [Bacillota bacterium]